jgi:hypothetical protein
MSFSRLELWPKRVDEMLILMDKPRDGRYGAALCCRRVPIHYQLPRALGPRRISFMVLRIDGTSFAVERIGRWTAMNESKNEGVLIENLDKQVSI